MSPVNLLPPRRVARVHPSFWAGARAHRELAVSEAIARGAQPEAAQHQARIAAYRVLEGEGHSHPAEP